MYRIRNRTFVHLGDIGLTSSNLRTWRTIFGQPGDNSVAGIDEAGLLDHDELAAELGLNDGEALTGFAEELAELDVPEDGGSKES
jgi:DNA-directed RNA polymerase subunit beta'